MNYPALASELGGNSFPDLISRYPHLSVAITSFQIEEAVRERQQSMLLSLSNEIAALRTRQDLWKAVHVMIKALFDLRHFEVAYIDEERLNYQFFAVEVDGRIRSQEGNVDTSMTPYPARDIVFDKLMGSEAPVLFDVTALAETSRLLLTYRVGKRQDINWYWVGGCA